MIAMKIGWLILEILLLGFVLYFGNTIALMLGILLILIPFFGLLLNLMIRRHLEITMKAAPNLKKGVAGSITVEINNPTWIPVLCVKLKLRAENQLNKETEQIKVMTWLPPGRKKQLVISAGSDYCGRIKLVMEQAVLYDCFCLLGISRRCSSTVYVTVQPDTFELNAVLIPGTNSIEDSEIYSQERPGVDLTETFQIREYVPGDSPRQIHWKLTNKFDKLIVRDPALPITRNVLIFWERTGESGNPDLIDAQAETIVSLCQGLLEQSIQFTIGWNDTDRNLCILHEIQDMDQMIGIIPRLMRASGTREGVSGAGLLLQTRPEALCAHMVYLAEEPQPELMEIKKYGRVSSLLCGSTEIEGSILFDADHYREQLSHVEM